METPWWTVRNVRRYLPDQSILWEECRLMEDFNIVLTRIGYVASVGVLLVAAGAVWALAPSSSGQAAATAVRMEQASTSGSGAVQSGPNTVVELPPTPMLDEEGKQRLDPDGKPMFNPPVKQLRDKKGHPVFDSDGKPVFQTATNLGYDENGKKIRANKEKTPKKTPVSISSGTLTVDGWTGKARLNYDIADFKYMYIYTPGIGITIVSPHSFPGAKEQTGAFEDKTLHVTVEGHPIELTSDKRLLSKKPVSAWVAVDRGFVLPSKFPVVGYGAITRAPYAWPGSKQSAGAGAAVDAPPLPVDVRPAMALTPCPAGMMRQPEPAHEQPCVPIRTSAGDASPPSAPK
jgi:hypothetical protein